MDKNKNKSKPVPTTLDIVKKKFSADPNTAAMY